MTKEINKTAAVYIGGLNKRGGIGGIKKNQRKKGRKKGREAYRGTR